MTGNGWHDHVAAPGADESWAPLAKAARHAAVSLGYPAAPCLPGEPEGATCDHGYADHALAYLVALKAIADRAIALLAPPPGLADDLYAGVAAELAGWDGRA